MRHRRRSTQQLRRGHRHVFFTDPKLGLSVLLFHRKRELALELGCLPAADPVADAGAHVTHAHHHLSADIVAFGLADAVADHCGADAISFSNSDAIADH